MIRTCGKSCRNRNDRLERVKIGLKKGEKMDRNSDLLLRIGMHPRFNNGPNGSKKPGGVDKVDDKRSLRVMLVSHANTSLYALEFRPYQVRNADTLDINDRDTFGSFIPFAKHGPLKLGDEDPVAAKGIS